MSFTRSFTVDSIAPRARTSGVLVMLSGDEMLLHDAERDAYHALPSNVFAVWEACNGRNSATDIAAIVSAAGMPMSPDSTVLAIAELAEAALLEAPSEGWSARLRRRELLKMAAAGLIGGALFPAIASMTAPESTAAASGPICPNPTGLPRLALGCTYSCQCETNCCRFSPSASQFQCQNRGTGSGCTRTYP